MDREKRTTTTTTTNELSLINDWCTRPSVRPSARSHPAVYRLILSSWIHSVTLHITVWRSDSVEVRLDEMRTSTNSKVATKGITREEKRDTLHCSTRDYCGAYATRRRRRRRRRLNDCESRGRLLLAAVPPLPLCSREADTARTGQSRIWKR